MFLHENVVKLRDKVFELLFLEDLFNEVFPIVPSPRLVQLAKVLDNEAPLSDALRIDTNGSFALGMYSESHLISC